MRGFLLWCMAVLLLAGCEGLPQSTDRGTSYRIENIAWVGIASDEHDEAVRFFKILLGFSELTERGGIVDLALPSGQILTISDSRRGKNVTGLHPLVGFGVSDIYKARRHFGRLGLKFVSRIQSDAFTQWVHFADAQGNVYELNKDSRHRLARTLASAHSNPVGIQSIAAVSVFASPKNFKDVSKTFYWALQLRDPKALSSEAISFTLPSQQNVNVFAKDEPPTYPIIAFWVADVQKAHNVLISKGIVAQKIDSDKSFRWFFFVGPNSLLYQIVGPK